MTLKTIRYNDLKFEVPQFIDYDYDKGSLEDFLLRY